jgi:hypothetical protein
MSTKIGNGKSPDLEVNPKHQVIDLNQIREKKLIQKRRQTERVFFENFVSVYSVKNAKEIIPVEVVDVSEEGCSFQIPYHPEQPWTNKTSEVTLRFYFNSSSYMEILGRIEYSKPCIFNSKRYIRFGCSIDKTTQSYSAYEHFVKFLKLYAESSHPESGKTTIQNF